MFYFYQRKHFFINMFLLVCISGCLGKGVETPISKSLKERVIPTVEIGAPNMNIANGSSFVNFELIVNGAINVFIAPSDIESVTTGSAVCTVFVAYIDTPVKPYLNFSGCTGQGTIRAYVKENTVFSSTGQGNLRSGPSAVVTIDAIAPNVLSMFPDEGPVAMLPTSLSVTFNEPIVTTTVDAGMLNFSNSTCSVVPSIVGPPLFSAANRVATFNLVGGTCADGEDFVVDVNISAVTDIAGNSGSGTTTSTYNFSSGPSIFFSGPTVEKIGPSGTVDVPVRFRNANAAPAINASTVEVVEMGGATCTTVASQGMMTNTGGTLRVSGCSGDGTVAVRFLDGALERVVGDLIIPSVQSANSPSFEVDATRPQLTNMFPAMATSGRVPQEIILQFSESLNPSSLSAANLTLGGCGGAVSAEEPVFSDENRVARFELTGVCPDTQTLTVSFNENSVTDEAGNAGDNAVTPRSYTVDAAEPVIAFQDPSGFIVRELSAAITMVATYATPVGVVLAQADVPLVNVVGAATCGAYGGHGGASDTDVTLSFADCTGDGLVAVKFNANTLDQGGTPNLESFPSRSFVVDNTGPTVRSMLPLTYTAAAIPSTITVRFNEPVNPATVSAADITVSVASTCTVPPGVDEPVASSDNTTFTFDVLAGGTCTSGQTLIYEIDASGVQDVAGNAGTNVVTRTYTIIP